MKYALIGCGRIAKNHINAALNLGLEIDALCDLNISKTESISEICAGIAAPQKYTDYRLMISEHPELDIVAIASDSGTHAEIALYCIEHGINVIIEKPMAMSIHDADEIIRLSGEKNVKVAVCHQNRFNLAVRQTKNAIDDGRLGQISNGAVNVYWSRSREYYEQAQWRGRWASDGGCLMNQCIHGIDLLCWMMGGDVREVYGVIGQRFHDYLEGEDIGAAILKFGNGAIGTIEGTVNVFPKNLEETLYLFGERGTVKLGGTSCNNIEVWDFADKRFRDGCLQVSASNVYGNGHAFLYADMIDAVKHDKSPYIDARAGKNALEIVLAIYKSQLTGKPVTLPLDDFSAAEMDGIFGKPNKG